MPRTAKSPPSPAPEFEKPTFDRADFARRLTKWFRAEQRDLPWRRPENARDPYRVLVSEFMLQQTTVAAVIPYYERFLDRFPTLESLAAADSQQVLELWSGLGYYKRARNLHGCARVVTDRHAGVFPMDLAEVMALPGIGRYTAGAVTSIAFDAVAPIVDANVARVLARILALEGDLKSKANQLRLWQEAEQILIEGSRKSRWGSRPSVINPALMELGALVCPPRAPRCTECPVETYCLARAQGRENVLPQVAEKTQPVALRDVCAYVTSADERVLLRQRGASLESRNWWQGMWELPRTTIGAGESPDEALHRLLHDEIAPGVRLKITPGPLLKTMRHGVTHHRITLDCHQVDCSLPVQTALPAAQWYSWSEVETLALPSVMRRLLGWLRTHATEAGQLSLA